MTAEIADPRPGTPARPRLLTDSQCDLLARVADGKTYAQIARELHVAEDTVKARMRVVFRILGARDRAHAVFLAMRARWVS